MFLFVVEECITFSPSECVLGLPKLGLGPSEKKKSFGKSSSTCILFCCFFRCTKSFSIKKERKDDLLVIKLCSIVFTFCFQTIDSHLFYLSLDMDYKVYALKNELDYVSNNWRMIGRPTIIIPVLEESLGVLLK